MDGPLAESEAPGDVVSVGVSAGVGEPVVSVSVGVGVAVLVGVFVDVSVGDLVGVPGELGLPLAGRPELGLSLGPLDSEDGAPLPLGETWLPDGPGVEGEPLDEAPPGVESSAGSSAGSPFSLSSSPADCSVETLPPSWASLLGIMPSVTTVPSTAASRTPAPAATRLRRAPPSTALRPPNPSVPDAGARDISAVSSSDIHGSTIGPAAGMPPGGDADSSYRAAGTSSPTGVRPPGNVPERSATRASARRPATAPDLSASAPRMLIEVSSSALARSGFPLQSARTPNS